MAIFDTLHAAGRTIVLVTHDPDLAAHCDRICRFEMGRSISDHRRATGEPPLRLNRRFSPPRRQHEPHDRAPDRPQLQGPRRFKFRSAVLMLGSLVGVTALTLVLSVGKGRAEDARDRPPALRRLLDPAGHGRRPDHRRPASRGRPPHPRRGRGVSFASSPRSKPGTRSRGSRASRSARAGATTTARILGTSERFERVWNRGVVQGEPFDAAAVAGSARVALIGEAVARDSVRHRGPAGGEIQIGSVRFRVVGLLEPFGTDAHGMDRDAEIVVPLTTLQRRVMNVDTISGAKLLVRDPARVEETAKALKALLRERHALAPGQPDDFTLITATQVQKMVGQVERVLFVFLPLVAAVSLVGRRRRGGEPDAGVGERAGGRDRPAPGGGRPAQGRPTPVPPRDRRDLARRRRPRARRRFGPRPMGGAPVDPRRRLLLAGHPPGARRFGPDRPPRGRRSGPARRPVGAGRRSAMRLGDEARPRSPAGVAGARGPSAAGRSRPLRCRDRRRRRPLDRRPRRGGRAGGEPQPGGDGHQPPGGAAGAGEAPGRPQGDARPRHHPDPGGRRGPHRAGRRGRGDARRGGRACG